MINRWSDTIAQSYLGDDLAERVYTSRLLGEEADLVLHGGGNTSVKSVTKDILGDAIEVLYVKGSGWDLATIEAEGFAPVKLDVLKRLAALDSLSDPDMVNAQRAAMLNPNAPNPSVEAILHAIIPFKFVDHTHADAVVTLSNTPNGKTLLNKLYGERVLVLPYVMPGFILAKQIYEISKTVNWSQLEGIVLLHHGIFSFGANAKQSYDRMIALVDAAEKCIQELTANSLSPEVSRETIALQPTDYIAFATIRQQVSRLRGKAMCAQWDTTQSALQFARRDDVEVITARGTMTPDHIIRTKRIPVVIGTDSESAISHFTQAYNSYFQQYNNGHQTQLDTAPRWAVWKNKGVISFGDTYKDMRIVSDIKDHTVKAISQAESLGGWEVISEEDFFNMEYWELEQAKLKKSAANAPFQAKTVLVTGAASGIGCAAVAAFHKQAANVIALDIDARITSLFPQDNICTIACDVTDATQINNALLQGVKQFGGLDILVSNAGSFPLSESIAELSADTWIRSIDVNLTAHQRVLKACIPFLQLGIDPCVVFVGSKNVSAPGPGVSAYSVPKAAMTQLARVAALELAKYNIRVNTVHPNAVFDTAIWTDAVLQKRAAHYGQTIEEYKKSNLLRQEITSHDVAALICTIAGPVFGKTTGAQIPIDGGNERVI